MNLSYRFLTASILISGLIFINTIAQEKILNTKYMKAEVPSKIEKNIKPQPLIENKELTAPDNRAKRTTISNVISEKSISVPNWPSKVLNPQSQTLFYGNSGVIYSVSAPGTGYPSGTNSNGDLGKYQKFEFSGDGYLKQTKVYFAKKTIVGSVDNFNLVVKSVGADGAPSTTLYTHTYSVNDIIVSSSNVSPNSFTISPQVLVSGNFFIGIEWTSNVNDVFALWQDEIGEGNNKKRAWEKSYEGVMRSMDDFWNNGNFDIDLWISAIIDQVTTPIAPVLLQPTNNATDIATNPTLSWNASSGATSYRLQVSTNSDFSTTVFDQSNITGTSQQVTGLSGNTTYYWHVNATNSAGTSSYSTAWSFTTLSGSVNLTPFKPDGWGDKIVASISQGDTVGASTIYNDQDVYINWAVINDGTTSASVIFYTDLFIDGNKVQRWQSPPPLPSDFYAHANDYLAGKLSSGDHTIQITADITGVISESNESDNSYSKTITVLPRNTNPQIQVTPTSLTITQPNTSSRSSAWIDYVPPVNKSVMQKPPNKNRTLGLKIPNSVVEYWKTHSPQIHRTLNKALTSVDWSSNDSAVKDQDVCGGCWAFSAIALVENLGTEKDLSEQVIISCVSNSDGCDGGFTSDALEYIKDSGVPQENCYPFLAVNGSCSDKCSAPSSLTRITEYPETGLWGEIVNLDDLKAELQNGPLSVSMIVPEDNSFIGYTGGIYHYTGGYVPWENNGHAVLIVGYNDDQRCFKVKNSWGTSWGENGYFRISYDDLNGHTKFGSYAYAASGVFNESEDNVLTIENIGNANLSITSITSNKNWLSVTGVPSTPITLTPNGSQPATVNVDWALVTSSQDVGTISISSNDPTRPTVQVQVTANKAAASLKVISPNGGETWSSGTQQNITWSYLNVTNVKIELTTDGGSSWFAPLVSSTSCDGSYIWNVPNYSSQQCKIKISDAGNGSLYDMSDNVFSIGSSPTITTSVNSIPDFGNIEINTNSSAKSYTVSGNNLKGNVTITAPTGFQVSKQEQSGFANSISLTPTNTSLPSTTIYVRFSPTAVKSYDGNISHTSTDAIPQNIGVWGNGVPESENASISLVVSDNTICSNTEFWVEVKIGDPQTINDLYGISFKLTSNNNNCTYVDGSAANGDFLGSSSLFVARAINNQTVDVGITKTSIPGVSGSGIIAKAKFKSSANISSNQTVIISLFDLSAINSAGNTISLIPATETITISASCNVKVWPGDCNNDGSVSAADLLPVGQYYGLQSQNSNNPGIQWQAYERNPWDLDGTIPKRIYADANGDGKINSSDVLPIGLNYGKTHSPSGSVIPLLAKTNESESGTTPLTNASLELVGPTEPIIGNTKFTIEVVVGENAEVTDLFGISFKIKYSSATCNYVENSMKEGPFLGNNLLKFDKKIDEQTVDASITKTAAPGENGKGIIATFDFISEVSQVVNFSLEDVSATDSQGNEIIFDVSNTSVIVDAKMDEELPSNYSLSQNFPNPFNPSTTITYSIPSVGTRQVVSVQLKVYDATGIEIKTLVDEEKSPGSYKVIFDCANLPSGVYFYCIKAGDFYDTKKLLLLK